MSTRAPYFRRRRQRLRRLHRCTRCGESAPEKGHTLCPVCLEMKKLKRPEPKASRRERALIERRLSALEIARARLLEKFQRVA